MGHIMLHYNWKIEVLQEQNFDAKYLAKYSGFFLF
jgi:hypothetical protein